MGSNLKPEKLIYQVILEKKENYDVRLAYKFLCDSLKAQPSKILEAKRVAGEIIN